MDASIILYKTLIHWMIWIDFISRKQEIMDHFDLNFFARLLFLRNARSCCRDEKFLKDTMIYKFQLKNYNSLRKKFENGTRRSS